MSDWTWDLDGWIVLTGALCAVSAALLGNFLVLRRMTLLGDAIAHGVLPGVAAAFFLTGSRNSLPMFLGAAVFGLLTTVLTAWIRRAGRVNEGAAMGVVFTSLFALGLVMIVQAADRVDLDPGCVLYGAIELTPLDVRPLSAFGLTVQVPRAALTLGVVTVLNALFVLLFFKELKLSSFDPALSTAAGFPAGAIHVTLMVLVALTTVASFESVGSLLVVAMFVAPPAAAYLVVDRLAPMVWLGVAFAATSAALGHASALAVPAWFGYRSTTTAGMMAVVAGAILLACVLFSPRHGVLVRAVRRRALAVRVLADDVTALLHRLNEPADGEPSDGEPLDGDPADAKPVDPETLRRTLSAGRTSFALALRRLRRGGLIRTDDRGVTLTVAGDR